MEQVSEFELGLEEIREAAARVAAARRELDAALAARDEMVLEAAALGAPQADIGEAADMTPGRVSQLVVAAREARTGAAS